MEFQIGAWDEEIVIKFCFLWMVRELNSNLAASFLGCKNDQKLKVKEERRGVSRKSDKWQRCSLKLVEGREICFPGDRAGYHGNRFTVRTVLWVYVSCVRVNNRFAVSLRACVCVEEGGKGEGDMGERRRKSRIKVNFFTMLFKLRLFPLTKFPAIQSLSLCACETRGKKWETACIL